MLANRLHVCKADVLAKVAASETEICPLYRKEPLDISSKFFVWEDEKSKQGS